MLKYIILQSIARQHGIDPDQDYADLHEALFKLATWNKWTWRPARDSSGAMA